MNQALLNIPWMSFNVILSLIPVVLSYPLLKHPLKASRLPVLFIWFIFLPNTIYLLTDLEHFINQLPFENGLGIAALAIQYAILISMGILTYFVSMLPVEWFMRSKNLGLKLKSSVYISLSLIMAFGVVLGKIQRTHSWYIVTNPSRVVGDVYNTLTTLDLILLTVVLGSLISIIILPFFILLHVSKKSSFLPQA